MKPPYKPPKYLDGTKDSDNALDIADEMIQAIKKRYPLGAEYIVLVQVLATLVGQGLRSIDDSHSKEEMLKEIAALAPEMADHMDHIKKMATTKKSAPPLH